MKSPSNLASSPSLLPSLLCLSTPVGLAWLSSAFFFFFYTGPSCKMRSWQPSWMPVLTMHPTKRNRGCWPPIQLTCTYTYTHVPTHTSLIPSRLEALNNVSSLGCSSELTQPQFSLEFPLLASEGRPWARNDFWRDLFNNCTSYFLSAEPWCSLVRAETNILKWKIIW